MGIHSQMDRSNRSRVGITPTSGLARNAVSVHLFPVRTIAKACLVIASVAFCAAGLAMKPRPPSNEQLVKDVPPSDVAVMHFVGLQKGFLERPVPTLKPIVLGEFDAAQLPKGPASH